MDFHREKRFITDYYDSLESSDISMIPTILSNSTIPDWHWRSYYPFGEQYGHSDVYTTFWHPFLSSFSSVSRRQDIFFAGTNERDSHNSVWVVSMGHLLGLFDAPFLGIPPTNKISMFRYCEFNRVESDKITETAFYFDLPHLLSQSGINLFPHQTGIHLVHPGPKTNDGLCYAPSDSSQTKKTSDLVNSMITNLGQWQSNLSLEEELKLNWHDDMLWWGPEGIGSTYTIERYAKQHSGPFRSAFSDRSSTNHICRLSEGHYSGFFGYPNFTATHTGDFLGISATNKPTDFRVIDIYRREGDKLAENWVFIDLLYWLHQIGDNRLESIIK